MPFNFLDEGDLLLIGSETLGYVLIPELATDNQPSVCKDAALTISLAGRIIPHRLESLSKGLPKRDAKCDIRTTSGERVFLSCVYATSCIFKVTRRCNPWIIYSLLVINV